MEELFFTGNVTYYKTYWKWVEKVIANYLVRKGDSSHFYFPVKEFNTLPKYLKNKVKK